MSENEKMTETEKLMKAVEAAEEKIEKCFAELQDSLQKAFACECGGPLLTEKEHSYLSSIVKPFRDRVIYIGKFTKGEDESYEAVDTAQIIKYICRWKKKNGLEDLEKAEWYLNHLIDFVREQEGLQ